MNTIFRDVIFPNHQIQRVTPAPISVVYMTQMLTMARKVNSRTSVLVAKFLDTSDKELIGIDKRPYPQSVLVDIAESYGLTDLLWVNSSYI